MEIPIPPDMPVPLPAFLNKKDVSKLFSHWRCGGKYYRDKLIRAGTLEFKQRPHIRGGVIPSDRIIEFYQSLL